MKLRFVAMTGVLSLAGLGLIGAGAHAAWTTNTTSNQQVSSGVLSVGLTSSVGGTCAKYDAFGSCQILTLRR